MIRTVCQMGILFVSVIVLGPRETMRIIEQAYIEEEDRLRSRTMKVIFENLDLEAENYRLMKAHDLDMLDVEAASLTVEEIP